MARKKMKQHSKHTEIITVNFTSPFVPISLPISVKTMNYWSVICNLVPAEQNELDDTENSDYETNGIEFIDLFVELNNVANDHTLQQMNRVSCSSHLLNKVHFKYGN